MLSKPWLQTQGTAMGTPAAPLYSILTFGYHENTSILNTFKPIINATLMISLEFGLTTLPLQQTTM